VGLVARRKQKVATFIDDIHPFIFSKHIHIDLTTTFKCRLNLNQKRRTYLFEEVYAEAFVSVVASEHLSLQGWLNHNTINR
jgi:hypothetical protein